MRGHAEGVPDVDHIHLRSEGDKETWRKRDPIILLKEKMIRQGMTTEAELAEIDAEADKEVKTLDEFQQNCPVMSPSNASVLDEFLYAN
jgi:TPP-dependent pyruvate/acetoin dehydrogenase alpha subunit